MGNVENKFDETQSLPLQDYVQAGKSTKDNRFGDFTLFSHKDDFAKQVALITKVHSSEPAVDGEMSRANELKQLTSTPNLVNILFLDKKEKTEFCSNYFKLYAGLEYFPFSLSEEILARQNRKERFTESELNSIEEKYLRGVSDLEYNGVNHLAVSTKKFLVGPPSQGKILFTLPFDNESLEVLSNDDKFYFSPAMFSSHVHGAIPQHNPSKSDVFSIGMCLLHAASMKNPSALYDFDSAVIREDKLNQRLEFLKGRYSEPYIANLARMLSIHEDSRPTVSQLIQSKDFSYNKPPEWIIYKETDPYAVLRSRKGGSRRSMSEMDERRSVINDLQHVQSVSHQEPIEIEEIKAVEMPPVVNEMAGYSGEQHVRTETITEPNLLLEKDKYGVKNANEQMYATLQTSGRRDSVPTHDRLINFNKPVGESKAMSEISDVYERSAIPSPRIKSVPAHYEPVQTPHYEPPVQREPSIHYNGLPTVQHQPAFTKPGTHHIEHNPVFENTKTHYIGNTPIVYKEYKSHVEHVPTYKPPITHVDKSYYREDLHYEIPKYEPPRYEPIQQYERYTGISSNVQSILNEMRTSHHSFNASPSKYTLLKSQANEAKMHSMAYGNTDSLLGKYGLRKSFNGQPILMSHYNY